MKKLSFLLILISFLLRYPLTANAGVISEVLSFFSSTTQPTEEILVNSQTASLLSAPSLTREENLSMVDDSAILPFFSHSSFYPHPTETIRVRNMIDNFFADPTIENLKRFCNDIKDVKSSQIKEGLSPDRTSIVKVDLTLYETTTWCDQLIGGQSNRYSWFVFRKNDFIIPLTNYNDSDSVRMAKIRYNQELEIKLSGQNFLDGDIVGYEGSTHPREVAIRDIEKRGGQVNLRTILPRLINPVNELRYYRHQIAQKPELGDIESGGLYIVKLGDSLNSIAKMFGISVEEILKYNNLNFNDKLVVGEKIIVSSRDVKNLIVNPNTIEDQKSVIKNITEEQPPRKDQNKLSDIVKTLNTPKPTNQETCALAYGPNSIWTGEINNQGKVVCDCTDGYEWNHDRTNCVAKTINIPSLLPSKEIKEEVKPIQSPQKESPKIDCAIFSSIPDCSLIQESEARENCNKCYPDKIKSDKSTTSVAEISTSTLKQAPSTVKKSLWSRLMSWFGF